MANALIGTHPWLFVFVKNGVSTLIILATARFNLFRMGRLFLPLNVAAYLILDLYWAWILIGRALR